MPASRISVYISTNILKFVNYPLNGCLCRYKESMDIIFIKWRGHKYHIIHAHEYPFTSSLPPSYNGASLAWSQDQMFRHTQRDT